MKKILASLATVPMGLVALADESTTTGVSVNLDPLTNTSTGIFPTIQTYISEAAEAAWPVISVIVGVAILFWLGRAMLRAIRSYFGTAS